VFNAGVYRYGKSATMRLKLTIAYDGRPYNGWQSQACGNTVQDHILRALEEVAKKPVKLLGGRPHGHRGARAGPDRRTSIHRRS
jgi:tRNA U38,U39,U40 pseudouridine synthase TruA